MGESGPQTPAQPPDKWVKVYTCPTRQEAALAVAKLRAHGLTARVDGAEASIYGESWFGNLSPLNPAIHVMQADAAEARALLEEVEQRRKARTSVSCPRCKADDPARGWPGPQLISLAVFIAIFGTCASGWVRWWSFLIGFAAVCGIFWSYTPRWRCVACGHRWIEAEPDDEEEGEDDDRDEE